MTNAMTLTNVVMTEPLKRKATNEGKTVRIHAQLEPVIYKLATMYPTWTFTVDTGGIMLGSEDMVFITNVKVSCDGETLGNIFRRYEARAYHICVQNDRIAKEMTRSPYFYKTKDPDKAVAKVKKYFSPQTPLEKIEQAYKTAKDEVSNAEYSKLREYRTAMGAVENAAKDYILNDGFELFMQFVKENAPHQYDTLTQHRETVKQAEFDLSTIVQARDVVDGKAPGAIVTRTGGKYIVATGGGQPVIYTDQTLPEWMRGGLGMLKLIEAKQFVTHTGMRVSENVFVLIGEDLTTVSQGESK